VALEGGRGDAFRPGVT